MLKEIIIQTDESRPPSDFLEGAWEMTQNSDGLHYRPLQIDCLDEERLDEQ